MLQPAAHDDFRPTASWENLRRRADLLRRLRAFFWRHGFLEVETPLLSADTVVDRHLDPFQVLVDGGPDPVHATAAADHGGPRRFWLQTSPEFGMKRLLAAGAPAIYQITRALRRDECGPLHNPEFTIVEWYRPGDGMAEGMVLLSDLCHTLLQRGPAEQLSYAEAFARHVGVDPHAAETAALAAAARQHGLTPPESLAADDRDGWLDLLLVERVQPHLGHGRPVILYDFPASQAALARVRPGPPAVAERFELYVSGVELANGYHELVDPEELRRRIVANNVQRQRDRRAALPEQSRLLAAMAAGLPAATGVALGFDRLAMLAVGAATLREVMAFPFDRA
jgi:elongation factor P--(R)-beta-lysine ligase